MSSTYLTALQHRRIEAEALSAQLDSDDDEDLQIDKKVQKLLEESSAIIRAADADSNIAEDLQTVLSAAYETLEAILKITYDAEIESIRSYTHDAATPLVKDPAAMENLTMSLMSPEFLDLISFLGGSNFTPKKIPKPDSFHSTPKPHANTSPLARFRMGAVPVLPPSAYTAQAILYGCCSISCEEGIPVPSELVTVPECDVLLMSGASGWKQRDPYLTYYRLDTCDSWDLMPEHTNIRNGLLNHVEYLAIDSKRNLIYAADEKRVKSFAVDGRKYKATHTLKSTREGPLAIIDDGTRLFRAGKGGVDVWDVDALPTHGADGKGDVGAGQLDVEDTMRDEHGVEKVERSTGTPRTSSIDFTDAQMNVRKWHLPSWWCLGGQLKALAYLEDTHSSVSALDLQDGGKVAMRYMGHTGEVECISSSAADPTTFITAGDEGIVRLFDVRHPLPQMSFNAGEMEKTYSALYVHVDGVPIVLTGGTRSQCIKVWDPRAKKLVYELATGNNSVQSLAWDVKRSTLYAATECMYMDRMGSTHEYRRAKIPAGPEVQDRRTPLGKLSKKPKPWAKAMRDEGEGDDDETVDDDEDEDEGDAEDEEEGDDEEEEFTSDPDKAWPKKAYHAENYFGYTFDCGNHRLLRYKFGLDAIPKEVPAYGYVS